MPRRETRHDIERALSGQRNNRQLASENLEHFIAMLKAKVARQSKGLATAEIAQMRAEFDKAIDHIRLRFRRGRHRPDDGSVPALVEPPRGPKPFAGGAAAPLEFD